MASKRRQKRQAERRQCGEKRAYPTSELAQAALRSLVVHERPIAHLSVYRCPFCGSFHVGHTPARVRQSIRDKRAARGER